MKQDIREINVTPFRGWKYCVSIASSYMSLNWTEHFFASRKEAVDYRNEAELQGYAWLMVTPDEY